jgi:hypothetical protein
MHRVLRAAAIAGAMLGASCEQDSTTGPTPPPARTSNWIGTIADRFNGSGTIAISLQEFPVIDGIAGVVGTWASTFSDPSRNSGGAVSGTLGSTNSLMLSPAIRPSCPAGVFLASTAGSYVIQLSSVSETQMSGTAFFNNCTEIDNNGTIVLNKR